MSQKSELRERIRAVADPLIADGRDNMDVRSQILAQLGIGIGGGGGGTDQSIPACKICGAHGGGGHGGLCPEGSGWE